MYIYTAGKFDRSKFLTSVTNVINCTIEELGSLDELGDLDELGNLDEVGDLAVLGGRS